MAQENRQSPLKTDGFRLGGNWYPVETWGGTIAKFAELCFSRFPNKLDLIKECINGHDNARNLKYARFIPSLDLFINKDVSADRAKDVIYRLQSGLLAYIVPKLLQMRTQGLDESTIRQSNTMKKIKFLTSIELEEQFVSKDGVNLWT